MNLDVNILEGIIFVLVGFEIDFVLILRLFWSIFFLLGFYLKVFVIYDYLCVI